MKNSDFKPVEELCVRVTSGGTPSRSSSEYWANGTIPWIKTGEIKQRYIYKTEECITVSGLDSSAAKLIPKNSVIVAMYGDGYTAGTVAINRIEATTNQACCNLVLDERKAHYQYIFHYLRGSYNNLVGLKLGGSQQNLNARTIRSFPIWAPKLEVQKKIAAILSTYDDLIEDNKRRIALLEKMAEEIYREWFVRMRFPGYEKVKFVKGVPEGWEYKELGSLATTQYGYTASASMAKEGPKFLRITDIVPDVIDWDTVPFCRIEEKEEEKYLLQEGDIVVARTGATVGYAKRINKNHPKAVFASYLVRLVPKNKMDAIYLGLSVERDAFKEFIHMFVTGAAQPQANATTMSRFSVLYPNETVLEEFNRSIEPILDQKEKLHVRTVVLSRTRDLLLPRLISGKLSVEDLDIHFPPSMQEQTTTEQLELDFTHA